MKYALNFLAAFFSFLFLAVDNKFKAGGRKGLSTLVTVLIVAIIIIAGLATIYVLVVVPPPTTTTP